MSLLGRSIGLVPAFLCSEDLARGKLIQVLKGWTSEAVPVHLLMPSQKEIPARTKAFMNFAWEKANQ